MTTTTSSRSSGPHATAQRLPITSDSLKDHGNSRNAQDVLQSRLISCFSDVDDSCGPASHRHSAAFRGNEYNGPNVIRSWSPPYSEANDAGATDNRDGLGQDHQEIVGSPRVSNSSMPRGDQEADTRNPLVGVVEYSVGSKRSLTSIPTQFSMRTTSEDGPEGKKLKTTTGKKLSEEGRVERNVREQKRSLHISQQISQIREMITQGGMRVQKATKCCVLQDAIDYIRILQENQKAADFEKHMLLRELGRLQQPPVVAPTNANVVPEYITVSTGSAPQPRAGHCNHEDHEIFGPPDLSIGYAQEMQGESNEQRQRNRMRASKEDRYHMVFDLSPVGMAIASLDGSLVDCNDHFCQITNITKGEIGCKTIFDLTSRDHLHYAFDSISSMISASETDGLVHTSTDGPRQCTFRTAIENRDDLGLTVALVTEDDGTANCFCVTVVSSSPTSEVNQSAPKASSTGGDHGELPSPLPMFPTLHDQPLQNSQRRCGPLPMFPSLEDESPGSLAPAANGNRVPRRVPLPILPRLLNDERHLPKAPIAYTTG